MDEDLPGHVEQRDGQRHPLPHEEHEQQQNDLRQRSAKVKGQQDAPHPPQLRSSSYREDGGSDGVDQQRLSSVPAELRLLAGVLLGFCGRVVSRETVVDVEPPQDAGPR